MILLKACVEQQHINFLHSTVKPETTANYLKIHVKGIITIAHYFPCSKLWKSTMHTHTHTHIHAHTHTHTVKKRILGEIKLEKIPKTVARCIHVLGRCIP